MPYGANTNAPTGITKIWLIFTAITNERARKAGIISVIIKMPVIMIKFPSFSPDELSYFVQCPFSTDEPCDWSPFFPEESVRLMFLVDDPVAYSLGWKRLALGVARKEAKRVGVEQSVTEKEEMSTCCLKLSFQ